VNATGNRRCAASFAALVILFCALSGARAQSSTNPLKNVRTFMYQLQGMENAPAIEQLAKSCYDLLVIEPTFTIKGNENFDAKAMVAKLKAGRPGRLVVAYVDVGEAERFRSYWNSAWTPPKKGVRGSPAFLLAPDPDGWQDDVSIAFWDPQWQSLWLGENGLLNTIMAAGFDGIYMDWVEAYSERGVVAEAKKQRIKPTAAMVDFIAVIRREIQQVNPRAVVIAQNAPDLIDDDPRYVKLIDGVGFEDTWFSGDADANWDSPKGGDIANMDGSPESRLAQYRKFLNAGIPVFTIDYCLKPENAARVYEASKNAGMVPLVTRVSLSRMTTTPPPTISH
jgi:cysteinyl-tRNA synthetase